MPKFVAHMEQVLDLYQKPYDPDCPVVCMDEQPVQLVKETRPPMAATKNRPRRVDYEYERAGTAAVFLFSEPLAGWRQATARARRTKGAHSRFPGHALTPTGVMAIRCKQFHLPDL